ncbi:uncharacterized protein NEMAJ01_1496 [Nematocida major]|uniref:uncharacterized protein n=1 Tax=Nematocida major TaxID=1912982 RepID=UPI00200784CE|nr:uncharacterized protein NEMAJ01_1496 [Nematocida major]KAH9386600.1 hypothetical protein NEMAJ01_1496 [Nematocida major]
MQNTELKIKVSFKSEPLHRETLKCKPAISYTFSPMEISMLLYPKIQKHIHLEVEGPASSFMTKKEKTSLQEIAQGLMYENLYNICYEFSNKLKEQIGEASSNSLQKPGSSSPMYMQDLGSFNKIIEGIELLESNYSSELSAIGAGPGLDLAENANAHSGLDVSADGGSKPNSLTMEQQELAFKMEKTRTMLEYVKKAREDYVKNTHKSCMAQRKKHEEKLDFEKSIEIVWVQTQSEAIAQGSTPNTFFLCEEELLQDIQSKVSRLYHTEVRSIRREIENILKSMANLLSERITLEPIGMVNRSETQGAYSSNLSLFLRYLIREMHTPCQKEDKDKAVAKNPTEAPPTICAMSALFGSIEKIEERLEELFSKHPDNPEEAYRTVCEEMRKMGIDPGLVCSALVYTKKASRMSEVEYEFMCKALSLASKRLLKQKKDAARSAQSGFAWNVPVLSVLSPQDKASEERPVPEKDESAPSAVHVMHALSEALGVFSTFSKSSGQASNAHAIMEVLKKAADENLVELIDCAEDEEGRLLPNSQTHIQMLLPSGFVLQVSPLQGEIELVKGQNTRPGLVRKSKPSTELAHSSIPRSNASLLSSDFKNVSSRQSKTILSDFKKMKVSSCDFLSAEKLNTFKSSENITMPENMNTLEKQHKGPSQVILNIQALVVSALSESEGPAVDSLKSGEQSTAGMGLEVLRSREVEIEDSAEIASSPKKAELLEEKLNSEADASVETYIPMKERSAMDAPEFNDPKEIGKDFLKTKRFYISEESLVDSISIEASTEEAQADASKKAVEAIHNSIKKRVFIKKMACRAFPYVSAVAISVLIVVMIKRYVNS